MWCSRLTLKCAPRRSALNARPGRRPESEGRGHTEPELLHGLYPAIRKPVARLRGGRQRRHSRLESQPGEYPCRAGRARVRDAGSRPRAEQPDRSRGRCLSALRRGTPGAEVYRTEIIPKAQETFTLSLAAFKGGQFEYLRVIQAQRALAEAKLEYNRALGDSWKGAAQLSGLLLEESWPDPPRSHNPHLRHHPSQPHRPANPAHEKNSPQVRQIDTLPLARNNHILPRGSEMVVRWLVVVLTLFGAIPVRICTCGAAHIFPSAPPPRHRSPAARSRARIRFELHPGRTARRRLPLHQAATDHAAGRPVFARGCSGHRLANPGVRPRAATGSLAWPRGS